MKQNIKMFWWPGMNNKNFGDILGPILVEKYANKNPIWSTPEESEVIAIGSVLDQVAEDYGGTIVGAGFAYPKTKKFFKQARVLALRGRLTLESCKTNETPLLADPGLLAIDLLTETLEKQYDFGIILHYADKQYLNYPNSLKINILDPPEKIVNDAAKCKKIITSSLHGLILADSLGLPRMWIKYDMVQGDGYKFFDYASSFNETIKPNVWSIASKNDVKEKQNQLRKIFSTL